MLMSLPDLIISLGIKLVTVQMGIPDQSNFGEQQVIYSKCFHGNFCTLEYLTECMKHNTIIVPLLLKVDVSSPPPLPLIHDSYIIESNL